MAVAVLAGSELGLGYLIVPHATQALAAAAAAGGQPAEQLASQAAAAAVAVAVQQPGAARAVASSWRLHGWTP